MGSTRASIALLVLGWVGCAPADATAPRTARARPSVEASARRASATAVASAAPAVLPLHIDAVAADKTGRAQRLYTEASMRACLDEAAAGDLGTLLVSAGTGGWGEPELEIDGLSTPLVRCLMGYVRESLDAMPLTPDTVIYVSVQ